MIDRTIAAVASRIGASQAARDVDLDRVAHVIEAPLDEAASTT